MSRNVVPCCAVLYRSQKFLFRLRLSVLVSVLIDSYPAQIRGDDIPPTPKLGTKRNRCVDRDRTVPAPDSRAAQSDVLCVIAARLRKGSWVGVSSCVGPMLRGCTE